MYGILRYLPKNHLSAAFGWFMGLRFPKPVGPLVVRAFSRIVGANPATAALPIEAYPSVGEFFVRDLAPGLRPIGNGIVSPVDGVLRDSGVITEGRISHIKGRDYSLGDFLGDPTMAKRFTSGYYANLYLSPKDYHHIHAPCDGRISRCDHIPGHLWPVNDWSLRSIPNLFAVNERVVVYLDTEVGLVAVVMVGATNVGSISVPFDTIRGNSPLPPLCGTDRRSPTSRTYESPIVVSKGERIGTFHLGSTVVLLFEKKGLDPKLTPPTPVVYGQSVFGM